MDKRPTQILTVTRQIRTGVIDTAETLLSRTWQDDTDAAPKTVGRNTDVSRPTEAMLERWLSRQQRDAKRFCDLIVGGGSQVGLLEVCEDLDTPYTGEVEGAYRFLVGFRSRDGQTRPGDPTRRRWADAVGAMTGVAVEGARLAEQGWRQAYSKRFVDDRGVSVLDEMADMRLSQTLDVLRRIVSGFRRIRGVACPLPPSCKAGCGRVSKGTCGACRVRRHRETKAGATNA